MELYICTGKDNYNGKNHYMLKSVVNGKEELVDGDKLKRYMAAKRVDVMNLTLTSDNRLVEASKDKIAQLNSIMKAPLSIIDKVKPLDKKEEDFIEDIMDDIIKTCIENYVGEAKKYCKLKNFNKEKNTCVMEFTLGLNSYVLLAYDKIVYGCYDVGDGTKRLFFDIGVQLQAISNKRASSKIGDGSIIKASEGLKEQYVSIKYREVNGNLELVDSNYYNTGYNDLKAGFGKYIMHYVSSQLMNVCENNPDIANNTNVEDYIKYDETKKEYIKTVGIAAATPLTCTVFMTAIIAFGLATNPEIIQTGILAKIANLGTTADIIKGMGAYAGGMGIVTGALISAKPTMEIVGAAKTTKADLNEIKNNKRKDWMGVFGK